MTNDLPSIVPTGRCPVCDAPDAYIAQIENRDLVFVECTRCRVYLATRKTFRHFEYLRWRAAAAGLEKLERLARYLHRRNLSTAVRLDYDTWESLIADPAAE